MAVLTAGAAEIKTLKDGEKSLEILCIPYVPYQEIQALYWNSLI